jgi:hypothetical protein
MKRRASLECLESLLSRGLWQPGRRSPKKFRGSVAAPAHGADEAVLV